MFLCSVTSIRTNETPRRAPHGVQYVNTLAKKRVVGTSDALPSTNEIMRPLLRARDALPGSNFTCDTAARATLAWEQYTIKHGPHSQPVRGIRCVMTAQELEPIPNRGEFRGMRCMPQQAMRSFGAATRNELLPGKWSAQAFSP